MRGGTRAFKVRYKVTLNSPEVLIHNETHFFFFFLHLTKFLTFGLLRILLDIRFILFNSAAYKLDFYGENLLLAVLFSAFRF